MQNQNILLIETDNGVLLQGDSNANWLLKRCKDIPFTFCDSITLHHERLKEEFNVSWVLVDTPPLFGTCPINPAYSLS